MEYDILLELERRKRSQNYNCVPEFVENVGAVDTFFDGQSGAAQERGLPIQWFASPLRLLNVLPHLHAPAPARAPARAPAWARAWV